MAPTPVELRVAADDLRRSASFVLLAFEDVRPRSSDQTWQGPAATVFRAGLDSAEARVDGVSEGLRAVALRLEARADRLEAEMAAAAREAELRREEEAACRRREAAFAGGARRGILALGGTSCTVGTAGPPRRPGGGSDDGPDARPGGIGVWPR